MGFSIVFTHKPRLHVAVNKGRFARGRNCDNSYWEDFDQGKFNMAVITARYACSFLLAQKNWVCPLLFKDFQRRGAKTTAFH